MALTGITMFRARDDVTDLDELIPDRNEPGGFRLADFRLEDNSIALVHYTRTPVRPPRWANFFRTVVDPAEFQSQSSSAVIAFQREGRWYLVTFGYGRYLVNLDLVEPSFGLRATLNGINPERIRSIDRKRVDTVSRLTREQLSRDSRIGTFGLDVHQDLLSAVTGVPIDERLGGRMYGKDAVGLRIDTRPRDLGLIADWLEELFQGDAYKEQFRWVDNIAEITGAAEVASLDRKLIRSLREGGEHGFDLAPPEIVDWSSAHGFVYKRGLDPKPELTLQEYYESTRAPEEINLDLLKKDRVQLLDSVGNRMGGWSVYRCLNGDLLEGGAVFVISDGKWYRIDHDFSVEVDETVRGLGRAAVELPPYSAEDENEAEYNQRVAQESGGELLCLDQEYIWPRSWQDRIEFCDLYRADRKMIHVKRYSGGSATLSHLFAQGSVSLRCLLTDRRFLADVDQKLQPTHSFAGEVPDPQTCHVVFAIVAEPGRDLRLPFFSRVALRNSAEVIQNLGAHVSFQPIENHQVPV